MSETVSDIKMWDDLYDDWLEDQRQQLQAAADALPRSQWHITYRRPESQNLIHRTPIDCFKLSTYTDKLCLGVKYGDGGLWDWDGPSPGGEHSIIHGRIIERRDTVDSPGGWYGCVCRVDAIIECTDKYKQQRQNMGRYYYWSDVTWEAVTDD